MSGVNNTFIGFRADVGTSSLSNDTAISNNAKVNASNAVVLAEGATMGFGATTPTNELYITADQANTSALQLKNLTSAFPVSAINQYKFLSVNGSENLILASLNGSSHIGGKESLWQRSGQSLQSIAGSRVVIGERVDRTPARYRLFIEEGILSEKVNAAVKNTNEWSDKV